MSGKMHADEIDIGVDLVRRLLGAQFPEWAGLHIEPFPSAGTVNALHRLGDQMAVRLPRLESGVADVEREHYWLPRLAPLLPVPIPLPLGKGTPTADYPWPWSVFRWLDGENPTEGQLINPDALATDLAEFVTAVRRIDLPDGPAAYRGGPLTSLDGSTRTSIAQLAGLVDTEGVTAAWDSAMRAPDWDGPPVWLHADLMPGNLLTLDGRLSAVIDFGTLGVGDPACDLIPAWNLLPAGAREIFRAALQVDDATWVRGRGRALSMALIQLPYYQHTNPVMANNARYVIQEVLADRAE